MDNGSRRPGWYGIARIQRLACALGIIFHLSTVVPVGAQTPAPGKKETKQDQGKDDKKQDDKKKEPPVKAPDAAPDEGKKKEEGTPVPAVSPEARFDAQGEATFILQSVGRFHSPYEGENSLRGRHETELSHTYTYYLGMRVVQNLEVYVNPELAWGNGIGEGMGLSAGSNGDLIGQGELRPEPYLARYFVRWRIPMKHLGSHHGKEEGPSERTGRDLNVIAGTIPSHRIVVQVGKMAINDLFDVNSYADNPRVAFMNNAFCSNLAYDVAQEIRGYNLGMTANWVNPNWSLRFGTFAMPTVAGGADLAYDLNRAHSEQIELELHPQILRSSRPPTVVRLLAFRNVGSMGNYRDALSAQLLGMPPDLTSVAKGGTKYGFGLNFEQALADGGDTGVFGRLGWNDGGTESQNFESDRFFSFGGQLSGAHWHRKDDRLGIAFAQSDLTAAHRAYLEAGGLGDLLGDGALHYDSERVFEAYYSYHHSKHLTLTLDYQFISNPGYNRDRGPVSFLGLRAYAPF